MRNKNRKPVFHPKIENQSFSVYQKKIEEEEKNFLHNYLMTAEKYVFYVSVPTIKPMKKRKTIKFTYFLKKNTFTTHKRSSFFYPNDFIQTNKKSRKKRASKTFQIKLNKLNAENEKYQEGVDGKNTGTIMKVVLSIYVSLSPFSFEIVHFWKKKN